MWGEIIARRLLADLLAGKTGTIGGGEIRAACDEAIKRIIGPVDRSRLIDEACRQFVELVAQNEKTPAPSVERPAFEV